VCEKEIVPTSPTAAKAVVAGSTENTVTAAITTAAAFWNIFLNFIIYLLLILKIDIAC